MTLNQLKSAYLALASSLVFTARLEHIPILKGQKIKVVNEGARISLEGELQVEAQKMQALEVAEAVCGSIPVVNKLSVKKAA
jgi:osmotically-inducible protein OsmY